MSSMFSIIVNKNPGEYTFVWYNSSIRTTLCFLRKNMSSGLPDGNPVNVVTFFGEHMAFTSTNPVLGSLNKQERQWVIDKNHTSQRTTPPQPIVFAPLQERAMTIDDVVTKTGITLAVIIVTSIISFLCALGNPTIAAGLTISGAIGSLIVVMVATLGNNMQSATLTIIYAICEGLSLGAFSQIVAGKTGNGGPAMGIIFGALAGTIGVFMGILLIYAITPVRTKITSSFARGTLGCTIGVLAVIIADLLVSLCAGRSDFFGLYGGGLLAIIFSLICIVLAAISFLVDFRSVDDMVARGVPASFAWGVALSLAVTLVWLYTEILRFLSYWRN